MPRLWLRDAVQKGTPALCQLYLVQCKQQKSGHSGSVLIVILWNICVKKGPIFAISAWTASLFISLVTRLFKNPFFFSQLWSTMCMNHALTESESKCMQFIAEKSAEVCSQMTNVIRWDRKNEIWTKSLGTEKQAKKPNAEIGRTKINCREINLNIQLNTLTSEISSRANPNDPEKIVNSKNRNILPNNSSILQETEAASAVYKGSSRR